MITLGSRISQGPWPQPPIHNSVVGFAHGCGSALIYAGLAEDLVDRWAETLARNLFANVQKNDAALVHLSLEQKADPNRWIFQQGQSCLHLACNSDAPDVVAVLIRYGARTDAKDDEGDSSLDIAVRVGSVRCSVMLLLEGGESVWSDVKKSRDIASRLLKAVLATSQVPTTARYMEVVKRLLRCLRAGPGRRRDYLFLSVIRGWQGGVDALLRHRADPDLREKLSHRTPLEFADALLLHDISAILRSHGASECFNPFHAEWALCLAASRSSQRGVECWSSRCKVNWRECPTSRGGDWHGTTALMHGAAGGHFRIVECLLHAAADPALKDSRGRNSAMYAKARRHEKLAAWLSHRATGGNQLVEDTTDMKPGKWAQPPGWTWAWSVDSSASERSSSEGEMEVEEEEEIPTPAPFESNRTAVDTNQILLTIDSATGPSDQPTKPFEELDLFVKVRRKPAVDGHMGELLFKTTPIRAQGGKATWNQSYQFKVQMGEVINLTIWDDESSDGSFWRGMLGEEEADLLGFCVVPLRKLRNRMRLGHEVKQQVPINSPEGFDIKLNIKCAHPKIDAVMPPEPPKAPKAQSDDFF